MSVIKSKRGKSSVQFMQTGLDLVNHTISIVRKFPKSVTFYISVPTANAAKEMYANLKKGNSIIPQTKHELERRLDYFQDAYASLQVLSSEIDMAVEHQIDEIAEGNILRWLELLDKEERLIRAQIKGDKERYKNLP